MVPDARDLLRKNPEREKVTDGCVGSIMAASWSVVDGQEATRMELET